MTYDPADSTVEDVKEHVQQHPEEAQAVLEAERDGKDRSTLTEWLEGHTDETDATVDTTPEPATAGVTKTPDPGPDGSYPPPLPT